MANISQTFILLESNDGNLSPVDITLLKLYSHKNLYFIINHNFFICAKALLILSNRFDSLIDILPHFIFSSPLISSLVLDIKNYYLH